MLVNITANVEQIKWHAQAALNVFETLELEAAAAEAQAELRALLGYLDRVDNANRSTPILSSVGVETVIEIKGVAGDIKR
jgi:hypothetical protein